MLRFNPKALTILGGSFLMASSALAGPEDFENGKIFPEFGKIAMIETDMEIPKRAKFNILFDTAVGAKPGELNRTLTSAARFVNMHAEAGVPEKNMKLAVVFHGAGSFDLTKDAAYGAKYNGVKNANTALIAALTEKNIRIILCGQSAAYHGIAKEDLLPNVEMALSAMTAHALLQQNGYTLNPF